MGDINGYATMIPGNEMIPALMGAVEAAGEIREGRLSSEELVRSCLAQIDRLEEEVGAWAFLDQELAIRQAINADLSKRSGRPLGPLHGLPVGVKDIFDTKDMPTEDGTILHRGRQPHYDATVVTRLRQAGAVIMGKTVTTELAVYSPGKTRNPH
jgi:Asp-tRNA(Asn)/Glu-tRNA(Gln) amidotransferase A subunit family amidase